MDVRRDVVRRGVEPRGERRDLLSEGGGWGEAREESKKRRKHEVRFRPRSRPPNCKKEASFALSFSLACRRRRNKHEKKAPLSYLPSRYFFSFLARNKRHDARRAARGSERPSLSRMLVRDGNKDILLFIRSLFFSFSTHLLLLLPCHRVLARWGRRLLCCCL